jgi:hypothetical protein
VEVLSALRWANCSVGPRGKRGGRRDPEAPAENKDSRKGAKNTVLGVVVSHHALSAGLALAMFLYLRGWKTTLLLKVEVV